MSTQRQIRDRVIRERLLEHMRQNPDPKRACAIIGIVPWAPERKARLALKDLVAAGYLDTVKRGGTTLYRYLRGAQ